MQRNVRIVAPGGQVARMERPVGQAPLGRGSAGAETKQPFWRRPMLTCLRDFCLDPSTELRCLPVPVVQLPTALNSAVSRDGDFHAAVMHFPLRRLKQPWHWQPLHHRGSPRSHPQSHFRYASDDTGSYSSTAHATMGGKRSELRLGAAHWNWRRRVQRSSLARALTGGCGAAAQVGGRLWPTGGTRQ